MERPMERLNAYSSPADGGGITVDIEGMTVDLITVCKAAGMHYDEFTRNVRRIWREVEVETNMKDC